jgi:serine phosphatase RsbU (regulator of sigma subunit)
LAPAADTAHTLRRPGAGHLDFLAVSVEAGSDRVLVVDDDEALARVMARTLRGRGFECDVALSGAEARKLLEAQDYAVALLDVRLPDESGYGLLEHLKSARPNAAVDDAELGKAAMEHGANGYFVKPVSATQLYLLVIGNVRRRTSELEQRQSVDRLQVMVDQRSDQVRRAAELQSGMLPVSPFKEDGFEIAAHFTAAREISGDFYDWYRSDDAHVTLSLGDVMGKGLTASLLMATARAALRGVMGLSPLDSGVKQAASVMLDALQVNQAYVTLFHFTYDQRSGDVAYVDAGHGHARVLRGEVGQELLGERSAPIGMFPETDYATGQVNLRPGDAMVVFSDGLLDLRPDLAIRDVQLPFEARQARSAQEMVDVLARGARDRELADDVTVLALRRLPL